MLLARSLAGVSRPPGRAVAFVGLLAFVVNASVALFVRRPQPAYHDEFSYLLAADTFAHGRLTNPTHPLWPHFESFHIIHQPTYQSKYPPAQGLVLALGQVAGHPMVGLWIATGAACAAVCWMLQAWLRPRWALLGALVVTLDPLVIAWWGQTYWGGAVPMLGGALFYGALPRLLRRLRARDALLMAFGLAVLADSRPVEGLVAVLPGAAVFLVRAVRGSLPAGDWGRRFGLPVLAVLAATGAWMAYYDFRVTGDPWRTPYQVWFQTYQRRSSGTGTPFPELGEYRGSPSITWGQKWRRLAAFYAPVWLAPGLLWLPLRLRSAWIRLALVTCLLETGVTTSISQAWPHYDAAVIGLDAYLIVSGLRRLAQVRLGGRRLGGALVAALVAAHLVSPIVLYVRQKPSLWFQTWQLARARIRTALEDTGEYHLVIVRYDPGHNVHHEWVYNEADIDAARVVWARDKGPERNRQLRGYFPYRQVWFLEADKHPPKLLRGRPAGPGERDSR